MLQKTIQLFTEKEEEFVNLLIEVGTTEKSCQDAGISGKHPGGNITGYRTRDRPAPARSQHSDQIPGGARLDQRLRSPLIEKAVRSGTTHSPYRSGRS